jgi:hypothetical protein
MGELQNSASLVGEKDAAEIQGGGCLGFKVAEEAERLFRGELQHRAEGVDANPGGCSSGVKPDIHPDAGGEAEEGEEEGDTRVDDSSSFRAVGEEGGGGGEGEGEGNTRVDDSSSFRARPPSLPSGWLESSDCGNPIPFPEGSRGHQEGWAGFLPCKVPLQASFGQDFTPDELIAREAALGREIGLVVDLTFTSRYYRGQTEFEEKGIRHKKIMVQVREA